MYPASPLEFCKLLQFTPDPHQAQLLTSPSKRVLLNCTRQWGKSTVAALKALHSALTQPNQLILLASPTHRQSAELLRKVIAFATQLQIPKKSDSIHPHSLVFPNQSRIIAIPGTEATNRGYSAVNLLIIDEAAAVPDEVYHALRPSLATTDGDLWLLSTPRSKRGFFFDAVRNPDDWTLIQVTADDCPRISATFLKDEKRTKSTLQFRHEYQAHFQDTKENTFSQLALLDFWTPFPNLDLNRPADILSGQNLALPAPDTAVIPPIPEPFDSDNHPDLFSTARRTHVGTPRFPNVQPIDTNVRYLLGLDLGQRQDHSALAVIQRVDYTLDWRNPITFAWATDTRYYLRDLWQWPLWTPFHRIVADIETLARPLALHHRVDLITDSTGLGGPVTELFQQMLRRTRIPLHLHPMTITPGGATAKNDQVPKQELVDTLQLALESNFLVADSRLNLRDELHRQLERMESKPLPSGRYSHRTPQGVHDDLVIALALAIWKARTVFPRKVISL